MPFAPYFILVLVLIVLLLESFSSIWATNLSTDINSYFAKATYFLEHNNLANFPQNEYQPGANLFFIMLSPALLIDNSPNSYLVALKAVNLFIIFLIALIYKKFTDQKSLYVFALLLLFAGPIFLFRFDLLVILLCLISIFLWRKQRYTTSYLILGFATLVKVYPIVLLPYFLLLNFHDQNFKGVFKYIAVIKYISTYLIGLLLPLGLYMLFFQVNILEIMSGLNFHMMKPVHTESLWGSLLTLISFVTTGNYALGAGGWGVYGISSQHWIFPLWFFNYFWVIPLAIFYIWIFRYLKNKSVKFEIVICAEIILLFLIFSKVFTPQYFLWFMLLIPLIDVRELFKNFEWVNLLVILLAAFLHQYIYPLNYGAWEGFYTTGNSSYLFWLNFIRYLLLGYLFIKFFRIYLSNTKVREVI